MLRVAKPEGFGNIVLEEVPMPPVGPLEVRVRSKVSLISRGSEILRRYMQEEAINPAIMGYSLAGVVDAVGSESSQQFQPGDRVMAGGAACSVCRATDRLQHVGPRVWPLPDDISFEEATFLPLAKERCHLGAVTGDPVRSYTCDHGSGVGRQSCVAGGTAASL